MSGPETTGPERTARLLVVHHTPSPALDTILQAVLDGARTDELTGIEVVVRPALSATVTDVLAADGYVLGTPANLGYLSGALKHFFDTIYYPCLHATQRRPFGLYVHGNDDVEGAVRGTERIVTGLGWRAVAEPVRLTGDPTPADLEACWNLGATVAASLRD
ncbi:MAG: flavodoxin family protein [Acidimicrobiales bacterium]|nr:flavodoxin family protein [Acidimicrobiales bacterium]